MHGSTLRVLRAFRCTLIIRCTACLGALSLSLCAAADITLYAKGEVPGTQTDLSGLTDLVGEKQPQNLLGAFGSGIAFSGRKNTYFGITDRGPSDGAADYRCRFHEFELNVESAPPEQVARINFKLLRTALLSDQAGRPLMGGSRFIDHDDDSKSTRFDPEAIRTSRDGKSLFISDEYGPWVSEFNLDGKLVCRLLVPSKFRVAHPSAKAEDELPPKNVSGRQPNRGLEGLAISPDSSTIWTMLQSPLIQDGALGTTKTRLALYCRTLKLSVDGKTPAREYVYPLADPAHGTCEMLAVDDHRFLVLERDGKPGDKARYKKIILADFSKASDVSDIPALAANGLPDGIAAATRSDFIDLLSPTFKLAGPQFPEKIEALAFGPALPDGRQTLLVLSDNDLKPEQPTMIWMFAFSEADLPGLKPQEFDVAPATPSPTPQAPPPVLPAATPEQK